MSAGAELGAGDRLGPYEIIRSIARGGSSVVYLARQSSLNRQVALKVLDARQHLNGLPVERLRREALAIASLNHPNIITIHDFGDQDGLIYIVMEFAPGGTLRDRMKSPLPAEYAAYVLDQICAGLDYANDHQIVHRDVKPGNILFKNERTLVLSDFGLVKLLGNSGERSLTGVGFGVGTPYYMAPEQIEGETLDRRTDVYGAGVVLFEMLSGHVPFSGSSPAQTYALHLNQPAPSLRELGVRVSPSVDEVVHRALRKLPADRFDRAGDLAVAFRAALRTAAAPKSIEAVLPPLPAAREADTLTTPRPEPPQAAPAPEAEPEILEIASPEVEAPAAQRRLRRWLIPTTIVVALILILAVLIARSRPAGAAVSTVVPAPVRLSEQVVVPAGSFWLGDDSLKDASPRQRLSLPEFRIDRTETTRAQFKAFLETSGRTPDSAASARFLPEEATLPVVSVSWADAVAYCAWSGGRLPSEAEWEKAARGEDGRAYPWGDQFDAALLNSREGGLRRPRPPGSYPGGASPYGVLDLSGNVAEWTASLHNPYPYNERDGRNAPEGEEARVTRGGSWELPAEAVRTFFRAAYPPALVHPALGFRCAQSV